MKMKQRLVETFPHMRPGGVSFHPAWDIPGLVFWLSASEGADASGTRATSADLGPYGYGCLSGTNKPALVSNAIWGRPAWRFTADTQYLWISSAPKLPRGTETTYALCVMKLDAVLPGIQFMFEWHKGGNHLGMSIEDTTSQYRVYASGYHVSNTNLGTTNPHILEFTYSSPTLTPYVDGVAKATATPTLNQTSTSDERITVGALGNAGQAPFRGHIADVLIADQIPSNALRTQLYTFFGMS